MKTKPAKKKYPKTFTIDRAKWLTGTTTKNHPTKHSTLRNDDGEMCCLGFYAMACGLRPKTILPYSALSSLIDSKPALFKRYLPDTLVSKDENGRVDDTDVASSLMGENDDESLRPATREKKIASLFKKIGVTVKFKGKYPQ